LLSTARESNLRPMKAKRVSVEAQLLPRSLRVCGLLCAGALLSSCLAIAQMGVHVAFFLHITSAPDQANNFLALAFGVFVTGLIVFGSIMIMTHLNHNMMSMDELARMQR